MRVPRGVAGTVVRVLERLGYSTIRQKGSHVRMRHEGPPAHAVTVPLNDPLKTGTLHCILAEVAQMRSISIEDIVDLL